MHDDLRDRIADAITYHPGNRGGSLDQREQVAQLLTDAVLKTLTPELEELDRLREVEQAHQELTADRAHPLIACAHGIRSVPVAALAMKIAEKRTALHQRAEACREVDRLRATLAEVLRTFTQRTHPGRAALQSYHVDVETVERWRAVLYPKEPS